MFAIYSLNIHRLLTQSIRSKPNLHVKSEHLANIPRILVSLLRYVYRTIAEYSLAVQKKIVRGSAFFSVRVSSHQLILQMGERGPVFLKKPNPTKPSRLIIIK